MVEASDRAKPGSPATGAKYRNSDAVSAVCTTRAATASRPRRLNIFNPRVAMAGRARSAASSTSVSACTPANPLRRFAKPSPAIRVGSSATDSGNPPTNSATAVTNMPLDQDFTKRWRFIKR